MEIRAAAAENDVVYLRILPAMSVPIEINFIHLVIEHGKR